MDVSRADVENPQQIPSSSSTAVPLVVPSPQLHLRDHLESYTGTAQVSRLLFVAPRLQQQQERQWCYERALGQLKGTRNTSLYRRTFDAASADPSLVAHLPLLDAAWAEAQDKKASTEMEELEAELNSYKQNLIRKKIRVRLPPLISLNLLADSYAQTAHNAIGALFEARGDYNAALRSYIRTQDYCTSPEQVLEMCLHVIEVSLHLGNFAHVLNYVGKAEQTAGVTEKRGTVALLKAVSGLAQLENRKYKAAARKCSPPPLFMSSSCLCAFAFAPLPPFCSPGLQIPGSVVGGAHEGTPPPRFSPGPPRRGYLRGSLRPR